MDHHEQRLAHLCAAARAYRDNSACDTLYYSGPIDRTGYRRVSDWCSDKKRQGQARNVLLVLSTLGGDAAAAYRIARALRHHYEKVALVIPAECKSAGTLLAVGASEIVICDTGELGPLDVQISKPDDLVELGSGLDVMQALRVMREEALTAFRQYLLDISIGSGQITVKTAGEMAAKLVSGLFAPVYGQIDPIRLGEVQRAISIAEAYGRRLDQYDKNLKQGALQKLIQAYPTHGFVIDRAEAKQLFRRVRHPTVEEAQIAHELYETFGLQEDCLVADPCELIPRDDAASGADHDQSTSSKAKGDGPGEHNPEQTGGVTSTKSIRAIKRT